MLPVGGGNCPAGHDAPAAGHLPSPLRSSPDRWPELRPAALTMVWRVACRLVDVTVVDIGFCLEDDEELAYDTAAPRRNGAALLTLESADVVVAVPSPVGELMTELPLPSCPVLLNPQHFTVESLRRAQV